MSEILVDPKKLAGIGAGVGFGVQIYREYRENQEDARWLRFEYPKVDPFPDDPTHRFASYKKLGLIAVSEFPVHLPISLDNETVIGSHDPVIEIHLGPQVDRSRPFIRTGESLRLLADYIQLHEIEASYVVGVTRQNLARATRRYGFSVSSSNSRIMSKRVEAGFLRDQRLGFINEDEEIGGVFIVYQRKEDLLARFGSSAGAPVSSGRAEGA